jgi:hypothetical protein
MREFRLIVTWVLIYVITFISAAGLSGCGDSEVHDEETEGALILLYAKGMLTTIVDGENVILNYEGLEATAHITHLKSTTSDGYACITESTLTVAKEDGSCLLELMYRPGFEGEGLVLHNAKFHAKKGIKQDGVVIDTIHCEDWPDESATGEVIYTLSDGRGFINLKPIAAPGSTQDQVNLLGAILKPEGEIILKFRAPGSMAKEFSLDLNQVRFVGDVTSTSVSEGECVRYFEPYPEWELTDVNETSPYHNETFGLHRYKGKIVVVLLSASW